MADATAPLVLVVEDEPAQAELLRFNLEREGLRVIVAGDGEEGLLVAREHRPDLVLLDWMLPYLSGIEVCRRLRLQDETRTVPVIMLTARGEETDQVRGLDTGADDYVVKPYSVKELMARVRARLRQGRAASVGAMLRHGDLELNSETRKVQRAGKDIKLGPVEYRLLATFMERPERVWSRELLLDRVWGMDQDVETRTVDVHIGRLRKALAVDGRPDPIRTVRGVGYALDLGA
ncbi:MAG TPA: phosphate regulon transcriptional regulatory protein PhoB [Aliiroseovarius sp.]|nr:phosphate regulon transcriptional regulatory protein PhoB [Aliiroseovarius sp.]